MKTRTLLGCALAALMALTLVGPVCAGEPIVANFWYSYGGEVRKVTEEMVKRFNSSQTKYRIDGSFQGDYFQALAKIRAAIPTKTAPAGLPCHRRGAAQPVAHGPPGKPSSRTPRDRKEPGWRISCRP